MRHVDDSGTSGVETVIMVQECEDPNAAKCLYDVSTIQIATA